MNTRLRSFITSTLAATLMAFSAVSYADDTEIYFAKANVDNQANKPAANVLFLIDTSISMNSPSGNSKMSQLKEAFSTMIDALGEGVNIGLAKFNGGHE